MRWLGLVLGLLVGLVPVLVADVAHARPSNPAFLGIGMSDLQGPPPGGTTALGPCEVRSVTRGSGAQAAGLQPGDVLRSIDGTRVANCDAVLEAVQRREPNAAVDVAIVRAGQPRVVTAHLLSRAEILRGRLVGQPIMSTELYGVEDHRTYDLSALRGTTAIVGWFDAARCGGCRAVFRKLAAWARDQHGKPGPAPMPLAVTVGDVESAGRLRATALDVPLALADADVYDELTIADGDRVFLSVIDGRGVVQYVTALLPDGDDADAVFDELFAAAEQASRWQVR